MAKEEDRTKVAYGDVTLSGGFQAGDLDDKLILQKQQGQGEGDYDLPSAPPNPWANHAMWFDRDGVDQWQKLMWGAIDGVTYNIGGLYEIVITLHAMDAFHGEAYMTINGEPKGFIKSLSAILMYIVDDQR